MGGALYFNSSSSNSLNSAFGVGLSAIAASRLALNTIGHNIANVNTKGYSRQETVQVTRMPQQTNVGSVGRGVDVDEIRALRDSFVEAQLAIETSEKGRLNTTDRILGQLESILNPQNSLGINDSINNLFGGFQDLASNPEDIAQREALIGSAEEFISSSNHIINQVLRQRDSINDQINASISEINGILEDIAQLNVQISGTDRAGTQAEDIYDKRQLKYRELSELMDIQGFIDGDGSLTITTSTGSPLVIGDDHATLASSPNAQDSNALDISSTFTGSTANITKLIRGGSVGALLEARDSILTDIISNQRKFAAILADQVNIEHRQGTDINGNQGGDFFNQIFRVVDNSVGANIGEIAIVGDNASYEVNYSLETVATSGVGINDITIDEPNITDLTKHDYSIVFTDAAGAYTITDVDTNTVVATGVKAGTDITFEGLTVSFDAANPDAGDTYTLNFDGRVGVTGDTYEITWTSGTDYEVYNITEQDTTPIATGTLAGDGLIFFDGLAVEISGVRAADDTLKITYKDLTLNSSLTAETVAASGSAPGLPEPGNNENALRLAGLDGENHAGLNGRTFTSFQSGEIASIGNDKANSEVLSVAQDNFVGALEMQRESVSGVSLDEEAAELIQYQQSFTAAARYISQVNDLVNFLINSLGT
jgi:flagellar hook-associated protein 1 FlgK